MASNDSSANSVKASESKETEVEVRAPIPANQKTFVSILHKLFTKFEFGLVFLFWFYLILFFFLLLGLVAFPFEETPSSEV